MTSQAADGTPLVDEERPVRPPRCVKIGPRR